MEFSDLMRLHLSGASPASLRNARCRGTDGDVGWSVPNLPVWTRLLEWADLMSRCRIAATQHTTQLVDGHAGEIWSTKMLKYLENKDTSSRADTHWDCEKWLNFLQLGVGVLLVTGAAVGYAVLHSLIVTVPALMGALLLFEGAKALLSCPSVVRWRDAHLH